MTTTTPPPPPHPRPQPASTRIRVLIADDHAVVRTGLRALLASDPKIEVIADEIGPSLRWATAQVERVNRSGGGGGGGYGDGGGAARPAANQAAPAYEDNEEPF